MSVRNLLTLNAVLVALVSLITLLVPTFFLQLNGLDVSQSTTNLVRAFGAVTLGYAVTSWLLRWVPPSAARRAFLLGAAVGYLVFAVVNVVNILALAGQATQMGWVIFALNLVLGSLFLITGIREPFMR